MRYYLLTFFLAATLLACNNESAAPEAESEPEAGAPAAGSMLAAALPQLFAYMDTTDPAFDAGLFEAAQVNAIDTLPALPLHDELLPFTPLFIYNADSSYAADLYSYNTVMVKRGDRTVLQGAGPDTEIGLIDTRAKTRKRIYFGGASSTVLDASWPAPNELMVAVGENLGDTGFIPRILHFQIDSGTVQHYIYNDTLRLRSTDFLQRRNALPH